MKPDCRVTFAFIIFKKIILPQSYAPTESKSSHAVPKKSIQSTKFVYILWLGCDPANAYFLIL